MQTELGTESRQLTDVVTRLRRTLRSSVRTEAALPIAQVELLQNLAERSPSRVGDLAERLHLANSTVSGLLALMMHGGLVERGTDAADRRAAVVTLSAEGRRQLDIWESANERRIRAGFEGLSPADRLAIADALPSLDRLATLLAERSG
jgi:DNA-binding MarR family transcriptional regulator